MLMLMDYKPNKAHFIQMHPFIAAGRAVEKEESSGEG
jgi:hypothetical protein